MIAHNDIIRWSVDHPWQTANQIEQDLLLSRAMIEVAQDEWVGEELLLRGGTAFHKLFLPEPYRYSEDLDYVRTSAGGIGDIMKRLTTLGADLGFAVSTKMGRYPKLYWKFSFEDGTPGKIKIEINTFERSPMLDAVKMHHQVDNPFFSGEAGIPTFQVEELVATKLRALYQRRKGRDLFDVWLALTVLDLNPESIVAAFPAYHPEGLTPEQMIANLEEKLANREFCSDVDPMARTGTPAFDPQVAGRMVIEQVLSLL